MKKTAIILIISIVITAILFAGSHLLTVSPGTISGNGNPTLLVFFVLMPLIPVYIVLWRRFFIYWNLSCKNVAAIFVIGMVHLVAGFLYQRVKFAEYKEVIRQALIERDGSVDSYYLDSITSGITIHVNNQYFNTNTFFMFLTATILLTCVAYAADKVVRRKDEIQEVHQ